MYRNIRNECKKRQCIHIARGVQYVPWVMHKCIMVKVGGNKIHTKYVKKQVNFLKTWGNSFQNRGEIIIFAKQGGKCAETGKIGGFIICG